MTTQFYDLAQHHFWATRQLLAFCASLEPAQLEMTTSGVYGTVIDTLRHIIDSEMSYLYRLTGAWRERPWQADELAGIATLQERAALLARALEQFLVTDWDSERPGEARGDEGDLFAVPAGIFLTQALHHANEHRAHICTILGARGVDPPDVSAWGYALATGRMTPKQP